MALLSSLMARLGIFRDNRAGNVALNFAIAAPALLGFVGVAIDLTNLNQSKTQLQSVADSAALAAAREMRLGNAAQDTIDQVARNYVNSIVYSTTRLTGVQTSTSIAADFTNVTVNLVGQTGSLFATRIGVASPSVSASARASVKGGAPLCMVTLKSNSLLMNYGIKVGANSSLLAPGCSIYSNNQTPKSLWVNAASRISAATVCAAGGLTGSSVVFTTAPQVDCPVLPDPLASRPDPVSNPKACDYTGKVVDGGTATLYPGVYCDGLKITGNAAVTLSPGIYTMRDQGWGSLGALVVNNGSTLRGTDVGFFFSGASSYMDLQPTSVIDITAPRTGPMAGVLLWEGNDAVWGWHKIESTQARNLLGTIYMPKSQLFITSPNPVADQSAYTIIVAGTLDVANSNLVLNTNYGATDVPVPSGVGRTAGNVVLDR
jgi:Flp pilus assembly protein TadG